MFDTAGPDTAGPDTTEDVASAPRGPHRTDPRFGTRPPPVALVHGRDGPETRSGVGVLTGNGPALPLYRPVEPRSR